MIAFPAAKINLGLNVLRKRPDGFHDIESVLMRIPLCDALEVVAATEDPGNDVQFTRTGITVPGETKDDLCMKALHLLRNGRTMPGMRVHLHKAIPIGAGLGGGSSDGAHMLLLLNTLLALGLDRSQLRDLATSLGSDCPFFLEDQPQLAEGRGERLSPVDVDLNGWWLVLVDPGIHVSTAEVYAHTAPSDHTADLPAIIAMGPAAWRSRLVNVMEPYVFHAHPEVATIKHQLYQQGAVYAAMSGSGSSVYGLFRSAPPTMQWPKGHRAWVLTL